MFLLSPAPAIGAADAQRRAVALDDAIILRDCSFRQQSTNGEQRACRTLMREAAITWRHGTRAGRWE